VLVNRQSASASEILAGALQDYGRGLIIGDSKTHGKGSVQSLINLDQNDLQKGSMKVTTANFHRINGASTQLQGITPDLVIPSFFDVMEVGEEFLPNALPWTQVATVPYRPTDDLARFTDILRARSEARQKKDPRFEAQRNRMRQFAAQQATQEITLNFNERLAMTKAEMDLQDIQAQLERGDEEPIPAESGDLVQPEALQILCDLIDLKATEIQQ
jgi:carboxyl-terminal processing protease